MQKLYFLRHGVAMKWEDWQGKNDDGRPLTDDGIKAMEREARTIRKLRLSLDVIVSSPLKRARQTANIVAEELDMKVKRSDLLKPDFNLDALAQLAESYAGNDSVMIVGHEPSFSSVIAQLVGGSRIEVQRGGLALVDLTGLQPPQGTLQWLIPPTLLVKHRKNRAK